jgi:hypothetical protein
MMDKTQFLQTCNEIQKLYWDTWHDLYSVKKDRNAYYETERLTTEEVKSRLGHVSFEDWKCFLKELIKAANSETIDDHKKMWKNGKQLTNVKCLFNRIFPNAKIYLVEYGNLKRDTNHFKRSQKLRLYTGVIYHVSDDCERAGFLGFNRKTKRYEVHTIPYDAVHNWRYGLTGYKPQRRAQSTF